MKTEKLVLSVFKPWRVRWSVFLVLIGGGPGCSGHSEQHQDSEQAFIERGDLRVSNLDQASDDGQTALWRAFNQKPSSYKPRTVHFSAEGQPKYVNRLILGTSPYLLQHAHNPVNWYPWGDEAFERAKAEDKPVLLSIGYSTCHWCHVMERESFEDEEIAQFINANYIAIKVDREERPDVDDVYMKAVQMFTGRGGWPHDDDTDS